MKCKSCARVFFCLLLICSCCLAQAGTNVGSATQKVTTRPDHQDDDRPSSGELPAGRSAVTTQNPGQTSGPENAGGDQQPPPSTSSAPGGLEGSTHRARGKRRRRQKTTTPVLDVALDQGRKHAKTHSVGDVTSSMDGGELDGRRHGREVSSPNVGNASSDDVTHSGGADGDKAPIYWPWGPQRDDKGNESLSSQNPPADESPGLLNGSSSGDRGEVYWPWGPNRESGNDSSDGHLRTRNMSTGPETRGRYASGDLQNLSQVRPEGVPWPWGPGLGNSSSGFNASSKDDPHSTNHGSRPGTNGVSSWLPGNRTSNKGSSWHVHHTEVPELDDARLADASVVVARAEGMYFIQRIFQRYGNKQGSRGRLSASDLAALLGNILLRDAARDAGAGRVHQGSSEEPPLYRSQEEVSGEGPLYLHNDHSQQCLSVQQLLQAFHYESSEGVDYKRFLYLCPALLYQLDSNLCLPHSHDQESNPSRILTPTSDGTAGWKRWLVAVASVLVISVVGLGCVLAVQRVPINVRHFLLPFLVAVAVGALSGDALLHLLPHALSTGHSHDGGGHREGVYRGLAALTGLLFFSFLENFLRLFQRCRNRRRHAKDSNGVRAADLERSKHQTVEMDAREEEVMLQIKPRPFDKNPTETCGMVKDGDSEPETVGDDHHNHAHAHGHAHSVPESMAAFLSMVVLGDGIHNLLDGLAIGAAFTAGLTSGLSTALAVLCHELPHEVGDFAMLLSAGMPVRRALLFNGVSSVLCVLGCLLGLAVGDMASLTLWLLAAVAGLFLYIALVSMLPQLKEGMDAEGARGFLLRASGIVLGAGIMLVIAAYEDNLKTLLEVSD